MNERVKAHLDKLFEGAPKTRRIEEMYEELLASCLDKYADLISSGMNHDEAFDKVINEIGDVGELLGYIEKAAAFNPAEADRQRRKKAFFISTGICGYFISLALFMFLAGVGLEEIAIALLIAFAGISTMLVVYGNMITVSTYEKADETLVEEMKVKMTSGKNERNKMLSMAESTLWSAAVVIYLAVSFLTGRWAVTWIIFLFAAVLGTCLVAYFRPDKRKKVLSGIFWELVAIAYLLTSFITGSWHITWIIFLIAVAIDQAAKLLMFWRERQ